MKSCVFAGTFDPITAGHSAVIKKALLSYDKVYVVIGVNDKKTPLFSVEERLEFINKLFIGEKRVEVCFNAGLTVDFMKEKKVTDYIRGYRNNSDLIYERAAEKFNKSVYPELNTRFIKAEDCEINVSSSLVKERLFNGESIDGLVPKEIEADVIKAFGKISKRI